MPMMTNDDPNESYLSPSRRPGVPKGVDPGVWRGDKPSVQLAGGAADAACETMSSEGGQNGGVQRHDGQGIARKGDHPMMSKNATPMPVSNPTRANIPGGRGGRG
jgi:hypothetical protein